MKKSELSENEIKSIIKLYNDGYGLRKIYKILNISPEIIKRHLKEFNVYIEPSKTKYKINHHVFDNINDEKTAYWLGFLFADGYVRKKGYSHEIKLKLSINDKVHLERFKIFLNSDHPIIKQTSKVKYPTFISISENVSLSVYSKQIFNKLFDAGCTPNKTHRLGKPNIDNTLFNHFIRGYFDGDGHVSQNVKHNSVRVNFVSSSVLILNWINETLHLLVNTTFKEISKKNNTYRLDYQNKSDLKKIYHHLYDDSTVFLERKKNKFDEIIKSFEPIKIVQKNIDGSIKNIWDDINIAAINFGIKKIEILKCCEKKINTLKGYKWEYYTGF